eukprot:1625374-Prymnesium_polylepis.2
MALPFKTNSELDSGSRSMPTANAPKEVNARTSPPARAPMQSTLLPDRSRPANRKAGRLQVRVSRTAGADATRGCPAAMYPAHTPPGI